MSANIEKITVLMPTYNCARYIKHSIKSILNQSYKEFELLIIDDGSSDNTEEIVNSFTDSRIRYHKFKENKGSASVLNYGLNIAKGDWIARIDADDINVPDRLETQIKFVKENPGYEIISSWSIYFEDPNKILFLLKEPTDHNDIYDYLDLHNPLNQSAVFYKKDTILKAGYNEVYNINEDFELFYRIRDSVKFYNIPKFLVYTRVRNDSKTYSLNNKNMYNILFTAAFKNLIGSQSKGQSFYWADKIAWINFFYGDKKDARGYFFNSFSLKNIIAYITTFLPERPFSKLIGSRIKYKLGGYFSNKSFFKEELKKLLK